MDIREYLERNLPNVNFNILPQIFEEEGIELTEEIVEYLKMTPWNTNWSILSGLSGNGSGDAIKVLILKDMGSELIIDSNSDFATASDIYTYCSQNDGNNINLTLYSTTDAVSTGQYEGYDSESDYYYFFLTDFHAYLWVFPDNMTLDW